MKISANKIIPEGKNYYIYYFYVRQNKYGNCGNGIQTFGIFLYIFWWQFYFWYTWRNARLTYCRNLSWWTVVKFLWQWTYFYSMKKRDNMNIFRNETRSDNLPKKEKKKRIIEKIHCGRSPIMKMVSRIFMKPRANCRWKLNQQFHFVSFFITSKICRTFAISLSY